MHPAARANALSRLAGSVVVLEKSGTLTPAPACAHQWDGGPAQLAIHTILMIRGN